MRLDFESRTELELLLETKKEQKQFFSAELIDFILSFFLFAPAAILFWASTWDFFYYYIYPESLLLSATVTLAVGLFIHLITYILQDEFHNLHDKFLIKTSDKRKFYPNGYTFRFIYSYALAFGYVTQWRGIWDLYGNFIDQVNPIYGFLISIFGLLMNCFVLKRSLYSFTTTVPYILYYDLDFDAYFEKDKYIKTSNVRLVKFQLLK